MERFVEVAPGLRLWAQERGASDAPALLLVMGSQASGLGWPDELVELLAVRHRVIRYDHRDTGRSTWAFDERPYPLSALAEDAVAVLDAFGVERAHVVGLSLGGMLTQLLVADHAERLLSATVLGTRALSSVPYTAPDGSRVPPEQLPGIAPALLELWSRPVEDRGPEAELERRVEHWRALGGDLIPFDAAHARADFSGMDRTEQLARTRVPALIVSALAEPVFPSPHASTSPRRSGARGSSRFPAWATHSPVRSTPRSPQRSWSTPAGADALSRPPCHT